MVPLSLLHLLWMQPLCTIGPLRRIAALVTVGVRQNLLHRSALPLRGQYPKPSVPPCTTRRLSARRRKSFYPRQRICTLWKVGPFYHGCQKLSRSFLHNKDEMLSRYGLQTVPELKSPGPLLKNCEVFGNMASNRCLPVPGCAILQPTSGLCCVGRPPF